jgi:hypothetical protein
MENLSVYEVSRLAGSMKIDADWSKQEWMKIPHGEIANFMGTVPDFKPVVRFKMMYDEENLYVIFRVNDRFIRCITDKINGPVWEDSCVEFFFSPDRDFPEKYFNLEMNCGGTALMHYNTIAKEERVEIIPDDIKKIRIAHTMPVLTDPELIEPVSWTNEYKIPLEMISGYSPITHPGPNVRWRANFYKIAENNSNPHFMTWSPVINDIPDFHIPQFFGEIRFK